MTAPLPADLNARYDPMTRDELIAECERLRTALIGLMPFHPEDELGPNTRTYWSPAYRAAYEAAEAALQGTR
jgi:hypothetical protein